ncbi:HAD family hydrolase [Pelobacter seleniigenes]|uniref:HAD family hydrolase n=1 Tax=Pelobacter seleniigenes TaxID=407188 RepID=UPI000A040B86|nr:HAD family hydrolase [Pelobacter seleniigenes]
MERKTRTSIKMVITDLDGTLLNNDHLLTAINLKHLHYLQEQGVLIVAATGRSLFKVNAVIAEDVPLDYVIFSSGAGVYDWQSKRLLKWEEFEKGTAPVLCANLIELKQNFVVFKPIPNNNKFWFHQGAGLCSEFARYLERNIQDCQLLPLEALPEHAGQMMCIIENDVRLFASIQAALYKVRNDIKVIRATSPVNADYIWLEVFPETVSKGHAAKWLCHELGIAKTETMGIGNDYNDIDLLEFTGISYTVKNAPEELRNQYPAILFTNHEDGFSEIVGAFFKGR